LSSIASWRLRQIFLRCASIVRAQTGVDPLDGLLERHGYTRSARELRPAGDKLWQSADERVHRRESLQRTTAVYTLWWWWWWWYRLICVVLDKIQRAIKPYWWY